MAIIVGGFFCFPGRGSVCDQVWVILSFAELGGCFFAGAGSGIIRFV